MQALSFRALLAISLFFATLAHAEKQEGFSKSHPHRCEGWFKKDPPEILPFQEALEKNKLIREMTDSNWNSSDSSSVRRQFLVNYLRIIDEEISHEPFNAQSPKMRSILLSWALSSQIGSVGMQKPQDDNRFLEELYYFVRRTVFLDPSFSAFDLSRMKQAVENLVNANEVSSEAATYFEKHFLPEFDKTIDARLVIEKGERIWSIEFERLVSKDTGRIQDSNALVSAAEKATTALDESQGSATLKAQKIAESIQMLESVNSIYFQTVIRIYKVFTTLAIREQFSADDKLLIQNAFKSVVEKWNNNDAASDAGQALLKNEIRANPLSNSGIEDRTS